MVVVMIYALVAPHIRFQILGYAEATGQLVALAITMESLSNARGTSGVITLLCAEYVCYLETSILSLAPFAVVCDPIPSRSPK